ncbi:MAG: hypothetical protein ACFFCV_20025 [Promethearchaeota archaeon]
MIKFKTFVRQFDHSEGYGLRCFENEVNEFLDNHKILDVQLNTNKEAINNWAVAGIMNYLTYVIKYEE